MVRPALTSGSTIPPALTPFLVEVSDPEPRGLHAVIGVGWEEVLAVAEHPGFEAIVR